MDSDKMTLTLANSERNICIECDGHSDIYDTMDEIRGLLIAWGFHPDSVVDGCEYISEEYGHHKEPGN